MHVAAMCYGRRSFMHDEANQTFLVGAEQTDKIEVIGTMPAVIVVATDAGHSIR